MDEVFDAETVIQAPRNVVWSTMTDWSRAPEWMDGVDELAGELEVVSPADPRQIGGVEPSGAWLSISPMDVASQVPEPPVRLRFPLMPNDHRCPARRFTALRTSMTESRSSRFSR